MSIIFYMKADAEEATDEISFTDLNGDRTKMILYFKENKIVFTRNDKERVFPTKNSTIFTETLLERYSLMLSICTQKNGLKYEEYAKIEMQKQCTIEEMKIINSVVLEAI